MKYQMRDHNIVHRPDLQKGCVLCDGQSHKLCSLFDDLKSLSVIWLVSVGCLPALGSLLDLDNTVISIILILAVVISLKEVIICIIANQITSGRQSSVKRKYREPWKYMMGCRSKRSHLTIL